MGKKLKFIVCGTVLLLLCVVIYIIVYYQLAFNQYYIPDNIDQMMRKKIQITEGESVPIELIANSIKDYEREINRLPAWRSAITVEGEAVVASDNLKNLSEQLLVKTNTIYDTEYTINQIYIEIGKNNIIYYFWMDEFFYFIEYGINGDIVKHLSTRRRIPFKENEITYYYSNSNNADITEMKMISNAWKRIDYNKVLVVIALGSLVAYVFYQLIQSIFRYIRKKKEIKM